jgi:hypothetical protein
MFMKEKHRSSIKSKLGLMKKRKDIWRNEWHLCNVSMAEALSAVTKTPGQLYPMDASALNINLRKMPGITIVYLSGSIIPQDSVPTDLTSLGEFVLLRSEEDIRKAYNYAFAVSGNKIYFNGPYKYFDAHHTPLSGSVSIEDCFGHIPRSDSNKDTT